MIPFESTCKDCVLLILKKSRSRSIWKRPLFIQPRDCWGFPVLQIVGCTSKQFTSVQGNDKKQWSVIRKLQILVVLLHVIRVCPPSHKRCSTAAVLASQLWCTMSLAEVMLKILLFRELFATVLLLATIGCFFEMHNPYMCGQIAWVSKYCWAIFIMAL